MFYNVDSYISCTECRILRNWKFVNNLSKLALLWGKYFILYPGYNYIKKFIILSFYKIINILEFYDIGSAIAI